MSWPEAGLLRTGAFGFLRRSRRDPAPQPRRPVPNLPGLRSLPQRPRGRSPTMPHRPPSRGFPLSSGILLGLGLGGFFDGIALHQLLQWHHLLTSAGYPPDSVENLDVNTF